MIEASDNELPALDHIVENLVAFCGEKNPEFPIVLEDGGSKEKFVKCKKNTGIMVREIMKHFVYEKVGLKKPMNTVEGGHSFVNSGVFKRKCD